MPYEKQQFSKKESNLKIATGLYKGNGSVLFRITTQAEQLHEAIEQALTGTKQEGKVQVLVNTSNGKTDAYLAFAPVDYEPGQNNGSKWQKGNSRPAVKPEPTKSAAKDPWDD